MTTKTIKIALVALLAIAIGIPTSAVFADAPEKGWSEANSKRWDVMVEKANRENLEQQGKRNVGEIATQANIGTFWTSSADCTHKAEMGNKCDGLNTNGSTAFTNQLYYKTPDTFAFYTSCGFPCINTDIHLSAPQTMQYNGVTYTYEDGTSVSCAPLLSICSNLVGFGTWKSSFTNPIFGAPTGTYISQQSLWKYSDGTDFFWVGNVNNMPSGY